MVRASQIDEMVEFIKDKVKHNQWPVLIGGDFNIDSVTQCEEKEYTNLMNKISGLGDVRDLIYEDHGCHPITYGDTTTTHREMILTDEYIYRGWESDSSFDYFFLIEPNSLPDNYDSDITLHSTSVNTMRTEPCSKCPCTHLSDHYAVEVALRL